MTPSTPRTLGFAIDAANATAVWQEGSRLCTATVAHDNTPAGITAAIDALARGAPVAERTYVTLCRPLAHSCAIELPRMTRDIAEGVLTRDATRYLADARGRAFDVSAREITRGRWAATFAPSELLEAISEVAGEHGWTHTEIQGADDALLRGAIQSTAKGSQNGTQCIVVCDETSVSAAVLVEHGNPLVGRRFLPDAADADLMAFMERSAHGEGVSLPDVVIVGETARAAVLARTFGARGYRARHLELGLPEGPSTLVTLAAAGMRGHARQLLHSRTTRAKASRRMRRLAWRFVAGAAAAIILAFVLERSRIERTLTDVRGQRADISAQVRKAVEERTAIENATDAVATLAQREASATHASAVAATVTLALPRSTALTLLTIVGDTVLLDGTSVKSAEVYEALRQLPILQDVRLAAPLRQELVADTTTERFSFGARIRAPQERQP